MLRDHAAGPLCHIGRTLRLSTAIRELTGASAVKFV